MYGVHVPVYQHLDETERETINRALALLRSTIVGRVLDSPRAMKDYLTLNYSDLEHEAFGVLWFDAQQRLRGEQVLFRGTLTHTAVYPREVAKQGLLRNAGAMVAFHNHPSGCRHPSRADRALTQCLKHALQLVDIRLLDHIVVSAAGAVSLAEMGLL